MVTICVCFPKIMILIAITSQIYQKSHFCFQLNEAGFLDTCPAWLLRICVGNRPPRSDLRIPEIMSLAEERRRQTEESWKYRLALEVCYHPGLITLSIK